MLAHRHSVPSEDVSLRPTAFQQQPLCKRAMCSSRAVIRMGMRIPPESGVSFTREPRKYRLLRGYRPHQASVVSTELPDHHATKSALTHIAGFLSDRLRIVVAHPRSAG